MCFSSQKEGNYLMQKLLEPSPEACYSRLDIEQPHQKAGSTLCSLTVLYQPHAFYYTLTSLRKKTFKRSKQKKSPILTLLATTGWHNLYSIWILLRSFVYPCMLTTSGNWRKVCVWDELMEIYFATRRKMLKQPSIFLQQPFDPFSYHFIHRNTFSFQYPHVFGFRTLWVSTSL